jgi:enoyl-CoA hydratase
MNAPAPASLAIVPQFDTLTVDIDAAVAHVGLNRPDHANAMNALMWDELELCFSALDVCDAVRVVVLSGHGRHFCAGIDLEMLEALHAHGEPARRVETLRRRILQLQQNLTTIERCRKPVIAAVQGACVGGGVDIIACCDMRYASANARFSIKEIDVGLVADVGSLQRLPYLVGEGLVRELAFTGREMNAKEAQSVGLVNRALETPEAMHEHVSEVALAIASKSPLAIRGIKQTLDYGRGHSISDGLDYVATWNGGMLSFDDIGEAIAAAKAGRSALYQD